MIRFTPEEIARLPKWAATRIEALQSAVDIANAKSEDTLKLMTGETRTRIEARAHGGADMEDRPECYLTEEGRVRFVLCKHRQDWIDFSLPYRYNAERYPYAVQIRSSRRLAILPDVTNAFVLTIADEVGRCVKDNV